MYCKRCGAPLPESGVCQICHTDHAKQRAANAQGKDPSGPAAFCKYCGKKLAFGATRHHCRSTRYKTL